VRRSTGDTYVRGRQKAVNGGARRVTGAENDVESKSQPFPFAQISPCSPPLHLAAANSLPQPYRPADRPQQLDRDRKGQQRSGRRRPPGSKVGPSRRGSPRSDFIACLTFGGRPRLNRTDDSQANVTSAVVTHDPFMQPVDIVCQSLAIRARSTRFGELKRLDAPFGEYFLSSKFKLAYTWGENGAISSMRCYDRCRRSLPRKVHYSSA